MGTEQTKDIALEWKRSEEFIEGMYYPSFTTKSETWCYTIYPLVRPKYPEPTGFHFAGWSCPEEDITRMRIEGRALTPGECKAMCESHKTHVYSIKISE